MLFLTRRHFAGESFAIYVGDDAYRSAYRFLAAEQPAGIISSAGRSAAAAAASAEEQFRFACFAYRLGPDFVPGQHQFHVMNTTFLPRGGGYFLKASAAFRCARSEMQAPYRRRCSHVALISRDTMPRRREMRRRPRAHGGWRAGQHTRAQSTPRQADGRSPPAY